MRIRAWTGSDMAKVWLFGLIAEVFLLGVLYSVGGHRTGPDPEAAKPPEFRTLIAAEGHPQLDPQVRDSVLHALAESLGLRVESVNGRVTIHGSPDFEQGLDRAVTGIGEGIWYAAVAVASYVLPIPLVLMSLTGMWLGSRWSDRQQDPSRDAA